MSGCRWEGPGRVGSLGHSEEVRKGLGDPQSRHRDPDLGQRTVLLVHGQHIRRASVLDVGDFWDVPRRITDAKSLPVNQRVPVFVLSLGPRRTGFFW